MGPPFESLGGRGGQQGAVPGPKPEDEVQYEIEAVLDERKHGGQGTKRKEYLVTYKNWGNEWDAWLSKKQIKACGVGAMLKLQSFQKQQGGANPSVKAGPAAKKRGGPEGVPGGVDKHGRQHVAGCKRVHLGAHACLPPPHTLPIVPILVPSQATLARNTKCCAGKQRGLGWRSSGPAKSSRHHCQLHWWQ